MFRHFFRLRSAIEPEPDPWKEKREDVPITVRLATESIPDNLPEVEEEEA